MESKKMKLIATGSGSQVYHYQTKAGEFALKYIPSSNKKQLLHLANEARVLAALDHDNIIKCVKYQEKDFGNVMVLEYAPKGSLLNLFNSNNSPQSPLNSLSALKPFIKKICQAIKYMHCKGYCHRDLKLENILVFEQHHKLIPKLSDFGFASYCYKEGELQKFKNYRGTVKGYMAPEIHEVLVNKEHSYDAFKVDIFSLGVIMFALVLGRLPFQFATKEDKLYRLIAEEDYESFWKMHQTRLEKTELFQNEEQLQKFKDLFVRMVHFNPQQRPTISEVLENSWFSI